MCVLLIDLFPQVWTLIIDSPKNLGQIQNCSSHYAQILKNTEECACRLRWSLWSCESFHVWLGSILSIAVCPGVNPIKLLRLKLHKNWCKSWWLTPKLNRIWCNLGLLSFIGLTPGLNLECHFVDQLTADYYIANEIAPQNDMIKCDLIDPNLQIDFNRVEFWPRLFETVDLYQKYVDFIKNWSN